MGDGFKRNGTTSLLAALDVKAGTVVGKWMARHRATEFRKFLDEVERNVPANLEPWPRAFDLAPNEYATLLHAG